MKISKYSGIELLFGFAALIFILSCVVDGLVALLSLLEIGESYPELLSISHRLSICGLVVYLITLAVLGDLKRFFVGLLVPGVIVFIYWVGSRLLRHVNEGSLPRVVPELATQQYLTVGVLGTFILCVFFLRSLSLEKSEAQ